MGVGIRELTQQSSLPKVTLLVSGRDQVQISVFTRSLQWKPCPAASNSGVDPWPSPPSLPQLVISRERLPNRPYWMLAEVALVCISGQVQSLYSLQGHLGHFYPQGL